MARVLLLNPPGEKLYFRDQHCSGISKGYYYWPPIDLIMLSGILAQEHDIKVIDGIVEKMSYYECLEVIKGFEPGFIVFLTGLASWLGDFAYMERVKLETGSVLIGVGDILLWESEDYLAKYSFLDAALLDFTSPSVLQYLAGTKEGLTDICYRRGEEIIRTPLGSSKEFTVPVPKHELFPLDKYRIPHGKQRPFTSLLTTYGCPYSCSYCIAEKIPFKYRSLENIMTELDSLVALGVKELFIKDFTFGAPRQVSEDFCKVLIERYPGLSWICSSRANVLDEKMLSLMKKAGCHTIQFGVESASQDLLDENNKMISLPQIKEIFASCRRLGIKTLSHFILGLPGETEESLLSTIRLAKELNCDYASFNIAIPLPGTTMKKKCIDNNWLQGNLDEMDASVMYPVIQTPYLSRDRLWQLRNQAIKSFYGRPSYMVRKLLDIRTPKDFFSLCREGVSVLLSIK